MSFNRWWISKLWHSHTLEDDSALKKMRRWELSSSLRSLLRESFPCGFLYFVFKLNLLGWPRLIRLCGFQVYSSVVHHLHIALCACPPQSSVLPYTFFPRAHGTFSRTDHMWGQKTGLNKFKKTEITPNIFLDHSALKLEINCKKEMTHTHADMWRLNNMLLKNEPPLGFCFREPPTAITLKPCWCGVRCEAAEAFCHLVIRSQA